jgi:Tol biopolymer transport system component
VAVLGCNDGGLPESKTTVESVEPSEPFREYSSLYIGIPLDAKVPSWSADGDWLAWRSVDWPDGSWHPERFTIWAYARSTRRLVCIAQNKHFLSRPVWSPQGEVTYLALRSDVAVGWPLPGRLCVELVDPLSKRTQELAALVKWDDSPAASIWLEFPAPMLFCGYDLFWSADGASLVYSHPWLGPAPQLALDDTFGGLLTVPLDIGWPVSQVTRSAVQLVARSTGEVSGYRDTGLASCWSPDGKWLPYFTLAPGDIPGAGVSREVSPPYRIAAWDLRLMSEDKKEDRLVRRGSAFPFPAWSADSSRLAFTEGHSVTKDYYEYYKSNRKVPPIPRDENDRLCLFDMKTGGVQVLYSCAEPLKSPSWTVDGQLLFMSVGPEPDKRRMLLIDPESRAVRPLEDPLVPPVPTDTVCGPPMCSSDGRWAAYIVARRTGQAVDVRMLRLLSLTGEQGVVVTVPEESEQLMTPPGS